MDRTIPMPFRQTIDEIADILSRKKKGLKFFDSELRLEIGKKLFDLKRTQREQSKNTYQIVSKELEKKFRNKQVSVAMLEKLARTYRELSDIYLLLKDRRSDRKETPKGEKNA